MLRFSFFLPAELRSDLFPPRALRGRRVEMESPNAIFVVAFTEMLTCE